VRDVADIVLWFAKRACDVGVFNVGSGKARAFRDLIGALFDALFDALGRERRIEYVDMPLELRERYQYFTQASLGRLRALGYDAGMTDVEQGVAEFVKLYLSRTDPYR
jgi:ADP-L-glycero-D-manno-heptose 6-epimerase